MIQIFSRVCSKILIGSKIMLSIFLELCRFTSASTDKYGTLYNEEFVYYESVFKDMENLVVLDIGANSGDWALNFLNIRQKLSTTIFCIEPYPNLRLELLSRNNNSIEKFNFAIGENKYTDIIFSGFGTGGSAFSTKYQTDDSTEIIRVKSISGDELIESKKIIPNLIKIDVDGMDFEVIRSLRNSIKKYRPLVQFEFTKRFAVQADYTLKECVKYLGELDYNVFVVDKNSKLKSIKIHRLEVIGIQTKNFIAIPNLVS